jgi:beta-xylosidase
MIKKAQRIRRTGLIILALFLGLAANVGAQALAPNTPLVTELFTADPSAHVFEGRIYIYTSHDIDTDQPADNIGSSFDMKDYHVYSFKDFQAPVVDHGEILNIKDVPWASRQLWAPDAAFKNGTYYLYFPAKDKDDIFRIGVATCETPGGKFTAQPEYIPGSFSMDPAVLVDDDGQAYMVFGGLWGGQLERWRTGKYDPSGTGPDGTQPAMGPRVAKLRADMLGFDGPVQEISILDPDGKPLLAKDHKRRFFEGPWMHKHNGLYYLTYSTGDTRYLVYATGKNPMGPFTYRGRILFPVQGWTTHCSVVEYPEGVPYLFYHDASLSGGVTEKRCIKYAPLSYNPDGTIPTAKR